MSIPYLGTIVMTGTGVSTKTVNLKVGSRSCPGGPWPRLRKVLHPYEDNGYGILRLTMIATKMETPSLVLSLSGKGKRGGEVLRPDDNNAGT